MLKYVSLPLLILCLIVAGCDSVGPEDGGEENATAIEGQVLNAATDAPVSGATVTTIPATRSSTTDAEGRFELEAIAAGEYTVIANASGYNSNTATVTVEDGQRGEVSIALSEEQEGEEPISRQGPLVPLDVGNSWIFQAEGAQDPYHFDITQRGTIDGKTFYRLLLDYGAGKQVTNQFVSDSTANGTRVGTILLVTTNTGNRATFYKYLVEDGASYEYTDPSGRRQSYEVVQETIEVPVGTFEAYTYSGYVDDPDVSISFAPGIGFVRRTYTDGSAAVLVDCETAEYSCE